MRNKSLSDSKNEENLQKETKNVPAPIDSANSSVLKINNKNQGSEDAGTVSNESGVLTDFFEYVFIENKKYGNCKLCGIKKNNDYNKSVPMAGGNTSGLYSHLKKHHPSSYAQVYKHIKVVNSKSQNTLSSYGIVVSKIYYFLFMTFVDLFNTINYQFEERAPFFTEFFKH